MSEWKSFVDIGEACIIEELSIITDSVIGANCVIEVGGTILESIIGESCVIGIKCSIKNSKIGSGSFISPTVQLDGVEIPDHSSVYLYQGNWACKPIDMSHLKPQLDKYYERLTDPTSPQYLPQTHSDVVTIN